MLCFQETRYMPFFYHYHLANISSYLSHGITCVLMAYDTVLFDKTEMMQWGRNVLSLCEIPNTDDTVATPQSPWRHANVNTRFRVSTESQIGVACAPIDSCQGGKGPSVCPGCSFTSEIRFLNFPALPVQYE